MLHRLLPVKDISVIGFTGTRRELTPEQRHQVWLILLAARGAGARDFHHGDCVGADAAAHKLAVDLGYAITVHPPSGSRLTHSTEKDKPLKLKILGLAFLRLRKVNGCLKLRGPDVAVR